MVVDVLYNSTTNRGGLQNLSAVLSSGSTTAPSGTPTGPFTLYPNSNVFQSGNYRNVPLDSGRDEFGATLNAFQAGYNAIYKQDDATISFDVAYTRSTNDAPGGGIAMRATAPTVAYDGSVKYARRHAARHADAGRGSGAAASRRARHRGNAVPPGRASRCAAAGRDRHGSREHARRRTGSPRAGPFASSTCE